MAITYVPQGNVLFGPVLLDLILNAVFRGVFGTPPSTYYLSLLTGTDLQTATEVPCTRAAVKADTGSFNNPDYSATIDFGQAYGQSSYSAGFYLTSPVNIYINSGVTDTQVKGMVVYDAATGGNEMFRMWHGTQPVAVYGQDIVRVPVGYRFGPYNMGGFPSALIFDWLFRGVPIDAYWNTTAFPNVYLAVDDGQGYFLTTNRIAVPRSTSTWAAPVTYTDANVTGARKLSSLVPFVVSPVWTTFNSRSYLGAQFFMWPTPQTFGDAVSPKIPANYSPPVTYLAGDSITFPAGKFDIILT